ncbi:MAG TPA: TRAP transporter large permease [Stellaceae bacterium]|nr:TRAP transporter large permease [Stellaceae bacterium]
MDPIHLGIAGFVAMFGLIALQVPIGIAMGVTGFAGIWMLLGPGPALHMVASVPSDALTNPNLAAIPMLLLMGSFAAAAGLGGDLYRLFQGFVGHHRGGLAAATIAGCGAFGSVCHSSIATAATFTRIALPEMRARGYRPSFAVGSIAAGGTLGILIPPSSLMLLYCVLTEQFVITLFVAAIIPALIAIAIYVIVVLIYVRVRPGAGPAAPRIGWSERFWLVIRCWRAIVLGVLVTGGIYGGVFTVIEAAAVGCVLACAFAFAGRYLTVATAPQVLAPAAQTTALIFVIVFGANIFNAFITLTKMPDFLVGQIEAAHLPPWLVIVLLLAMYLISGCVFESVAAMIITLPVVFPLVVGLGFDPIWWGVINIMVIEHGQLTPPIGIIAYILHGIAPDIPLKTIFAGITPFFLSDFVKLALLALFPALSLWLPRVLAMPM